MISLNNQIERLILDTHVLIWCVEGIKLNKEQIALIEKMSESASLFASAISFWEIKMLLKKDKVSLPISFDEWLNKVTSHLKLNIIDLSMPILISSCELPNCDHKDPADRFIIASCRHMDSHLMTFDQKILDYGQKGYLKIA